MLHCWGQRYDAHELYEGKIPMSSCGDSGIMCMVLLWKGAVLRIAR